jgi:carbon monoxide dehydrogenase subunit G
MKKTVLWIFYVLLGLFLVFVAGGYALPDKSHVERQTVINATPDKVFAVVSDLQRAKDWSPWFGLDPAMRVTFEGPGGNPGPGVGQKMKWSSSNPNVGSGSQETVEFVANEKVVAALDFGDMGKATAGVLLAPEGAGTKVTWTFDTALDSMMARWFGLMFERWIGADYEKGLANLKAFVEKQG